MTYKQSQLFGKGGLLLKLKRVFFDVFIYSCINRLLQLLSSQMKLCLKVHTRPFALLVFFMFFFLRVCNVFLGERTYRPNSSNPILDPNL